METNLLSGLKDIGYEGPLLDQTSIKAALEEGAKSIEFTKLVSFLTNELRTLLNLDEEVNAITSPEDSVAFVMEVSSFLKELNCPYSNLIHGHISDRLQTVNERLLLLDYLVKELMGARILQERKPDKKIELKLQETEEAASMRKILMTLRFPRPPPNITVQALFQKLAPTLHTTIQKAGPDLVGFPAFNGHLSDKQWETMNGVQRDLNAEYKIRREMLLTRLDVTIQSFQWSDRTKGKDDLFEKVYNEKRKRLKADPDVDLSDVIAARNEIAIIEKTSSSSVRKNTRSSLNKVIIGQVPDRGGRTSEQAPPPPEMPSWQQRAPGGGGNFGRGGGNRGGGNFSRGGGGGFSRGGGGSNFSRGGGGGNSFSSNQGGGYGNNRSSFDSAGSYGGGAAQASFDKGSGYGSGGFNQNRSFDSAGSYSVSSRGGGNFDSNKSGATSGYSSGQKFGSGFSEETKSILSMSYSDIRSGKFRPNSNHGSSGYSDSRSGPSDSRGGGYSSGSSYGNKSFDSAGSYGKDYQYEQDTKRAKTYDSYQSNRTTYADQYVKEEQHNQQYRGGGGGGGDKSRGRSNYNRGGRH